jgi:sec-independent protein translocase protein TatA
MFRALEPWHFLILAALVVVLFGGKRLPDAARGLGRSMRIFKSELKQLNAEETTSPTPPAAPPPLEGRVMDENAGRSTAPSQPRRDA